MSLYGQLSANEIIVLSNRFGIELTEDFQLLTGGSANTNYLIKDSKAKYILSVCEAKNEIEVKKMVGLLDYLKSKGFNTNLCYKTVEGNTHTLHKNKPVILKSFIEGNVPGSLEMKSAGILGNKLAQLHMIEAPKDVSKRHAYGEEVIVHFLKSTKIDHSFLEWLKEKMTALRPVLDMDLPKCLIHGDIFCDNLVINDQEVYIIDFEEACYEKRVFDVGMTILGCCQMNNVIDLDLACVLLNEYQKIIPLHTIELETLKYFISYAAVGTAFWRFKQFNIDTPLEEKKDRYIEMMKIAEEAMGWDESLFTKKSPGL